MGRTCWDGNQSSPWMNVWVVCAGAFMRGKWQIGFAACRHIEKGDEVVCDYGWEGEGRGR